MRRHLFMMLVILILPLTVSARPELVDVINLQDGSKLCGEIVAQSEDSVKIKLEIENKMQVLAIPRAVILSIVKTPDRYAMDIGPFSNFYTYTQTYFLSGPEGIVPGGSFIFGTLMGQKTYAGLGFGFESHPKRRVFPVFLEFRYDFLKRESTPYLSISPGYSLGTARNKSPDKAGLSLKSNLGYKIYLRPFSVHLEIGHRMQNFKELPSWENSYREYVEGYGEFNFVHFISFTVGISYCGK